MVAFRLVVNPMNPGKFAFREQFRLGFQPVLHFVPGQRTLVDITEVCPARHLVRRYRKINFVLAQRCRGSRPEDIGMFLVLILGEFIVIHKMRIDRALVRPLWGVNNSWFSIFRIDSPPT